MKIGIIGVGNMGSKYAVMIAKGEINGMELAAVTRVNEERWEELKRYASPKLVRVHSADDLFFEIDQGKLHLDGIIIATPHYSHEELAIKAFDRGISVLCDKPAGVYSRQARNMMNAYRKGKEKHPSLKYGFIFHQRTFPVYRKIKEIVDSRQYGSIRRVNWVITDWYRPNAYYDAVSWRGTWKYDGGGTLLNQCPHNLDLLVWICGKPESVVGFCKEGQFHPIEVEDDVTAYLEWENGASGVLIASTGEAPGVNRLEISLDDALLVCENGRVRAAVLDKPELMYRNGQGDVFAKPKFEWKEIEVEPEAGAYQKVLDGFVRGELIAEGEEAIESLYLSNAIYLSSWKHRKIQIPQRESDYELEFEKEYEEALAEKRIQ